MDINTLLGKVDTENNRQIKVDTTEFIETLSQDFEN